MVKSTMYIKLFMDPISTYLLLNSLACEAHTTTETRLKKTFSAHTMIFIYVFLRHIFPFLSFAQYAIIICHVQTKSLHFE